MCRPARISRGRSSRSWIQAVSAAEPQSRISSAPASRSVDGLLLGRVVGDRAVVVEAEVAVRVDQPGDDPAVHRALGAGHRLEGDPAVDDVQVAGLAVGQDGTGEPERSSHAPDATGYGGGDQLRRRPGSDEGGAQPRCAIATSVTATAMAVTVTANAAV